MAVAASGARASIRGKAAPIFHVQTTDSAFHCAGDHKDFSAPEAALAAGIDGAIAIAADQIRQGEPASAVEVRVMDLEEATVLRSVVSISVASLLSDARPPWPS